MNLWLRLLHLILASFFRRRLDPARDVSRLAFRVWPHDLEMSFPDEFLDRWDGLPLLTWDDPAAQNDADQKQHVSHKVL